MKKIFQLLIDTRTGTHIVNALDKDGNYTPIEIVKDPTGQMRVYQQGLEQFNARYVISVVFFSDDARINGKPI